MHSKKCSKCGEEKPIIEFHKSKLGKYGVGSICKICRKEEHKSPSRKEYHKKYYQDNKDGKILEYKEKNKEIISIKDKERHKKYYQKNKIELDIKNKRNKGKYKEYYRNYEKNRSEIDPYYRFERNLRQRIRSAISELSKSGKTKSCKEYGIDFEAIFNRVGPKPDKSFHLDHIIPQSLFDLDNPEHVRLAHVPENLRWLPGKENLEKHDKIILSLIETNPILLNIFEIIKGISK